MEGVEEGLRALLKKAVSLGYFRGFKVGNSDIVVSHLQYADETLLISETCVGNLRCMESIIIWFRYFKGLKAGNSQMALEDAIFSWLFFGL